MNYQPALQAALANPIRFAEAISGVKLRSYQQQVAQAIADSVKNKRGLTFVVLFPRQAGRPPARHRPRHRRPHPPANRLAARRLAKDQEEESW